jgi:quercetin dioxygenase-like cupin family protein
MRSVRLAVVAVAALLSGAAAFGPPGHRAAPAPAVNWGPAPPFFPAGARFAVLQGDPSGSGLYTVRLEMPAGYVIKPHWHPTDENVTVISGTFEVGMGDAVSAQGAQTLTAGGFITAPANAHHFAVARRKTIVQVHGMGPFAITYVNAGDDPRGTTASR